MDQKLIPDHPANIEAVPDRLNHAKIGESQVPELPLMYAHFGNVKSMDEHRRLRKQLYRVKFYLRDGAWHTLAEIAKACGISETSASARLRDFRKIHFGAQRMDRKSSEVPNVYLYRVILNPQDADVQRWLKEEENSARRYFHAKHPKAANP
jgi:hypothetical protein